MRYIVHVAEGGRPGRAVPMLWQVLYAEQQSWASAEDMSEDEQG